MASSSCSGSYPEHIVILPEASSGSGAASCLAPPGAAEPMFLVGRRRIPISPVNPELLERLREDFDRKDVPSRLGESGRYASPPSCRAPPESAVLLNDDNRIFGLFCCI